MENTEWISVKDALPKSTMRVLAIGNNGKHQFVGFYTAGRDVEVSDDEGFDNDCTGCEDLDYCYLKSGWYEEEETPRSDYDFTYIHRDVTHWTLLPKPPVQ